VVSDLRREIEWVRSESEGETKFQVSNEISRPESNS